MNSKEMAYHKMLRKVHRLQSDVEHSVAGPLGEFISVKQFYELLDELNAIEEEIYKVLRTKQTYPSSDDQEGGTLVFPWDLPFTLANMIELKRK